MSEEKTLNQRAQDSSQMNEQPGQQDNLIDGIITQTIKFSQEKKDLIKRTIAKDLLPDEYESFIANAERAGLDPMFKQIYAFIEEPKRQNETTGKWEKTGERKLNIFASIDGLRLVADRTRRYCPGCDTEYQYDERGKLISAKVWVKKFIRGQWHEFPETAFLDEFYRNTPTWNYKKRVMLSKCAEARVLRRGWPAELSGIYTPEEFGEDGGIIDQATGDVKPKATGPTLKDLSDKAKAAGLSKEQWDLLCKRCEIKRDARTQTPVRLKALEELINKNAKPATDTGATIPEDAIKLLTDTLVSEGYESLTEQIAFCSKISDRLITAFDQITGYEYSRIMQSLETKTYGDEPPADSEVV
jgi:phage recombination protein Bet